MITKIVILLLFILIYFNSVKKPKLIHSNQYTSRIQFKYIFPPILFNSGFSHTIIASLLKKKTVNNYNNKKIITIDVEDGIQLEIDVFEPKLQQHTNLNSNYKVINNIKQTFNIIFNQIFKINSSTVYSANNIRSNVILLHGLHGSSNSKYIIDAVDVFLEKNCRIFCLNMRGQRGIFRSINFSHIGHTTDLHLLYNYITTYYTEPLFYIGFSQGANMITKFFGEINPMDNRIIGGISVCNPFNFQKAEQLTIESGFLGKISHWIVTKIFKMHLEQNLFLKNNIKNINLKNEIMNSKTPYDILTILAKYNMLDGYKDAALFLKENSSEYFISKITKPLLFINSEDDPIIPLKAIPVSQISNNKNTALITLKGGHLGFRSIFLSNVLDTFMSDFFEAVIKTK